MEVFEGSSRSRRSRGCSRSPRPVRVVPPICFVDVVPVDGQRKALSLRGELDASCARAIEDELVAVVGRHRECRVDLSQLEFIDGAGIQALQRAVRRAASARSTLRFHGVRPHQLQIFRFIGAGDIVEQPSTNHGEA